MTTTEEDQIGELLLQAATSAAPAGSLAATSLKLGRRRLLRRRLVAGGVGIALVAAAPAVVWTWSRSGDSRVVVAASGAPSGTVPLTVDCHDRGGTNTGTVDSGAEAGEPDAPAEQATRWAQGSGLDTLFPGVTVSGVAERGGGVVVALTDAHGVARGLLTFERASGGWRLAGISSC